MEGHAQGSSGEEMKEIDGVTDLTCARHSKYTNQVGIWDMVGGGGTVHGVQHGAQYILEGK